MDEFYDLNEFFAVGIRRINNIVRIIIVFIVFMAFARGVSVYGKQSVTVPVLKGAVWGGMTGVIVSLTYVFAVYVSSKFINKTADLHGLGINVIGVCKIKRRIKFVEKLLERMERGTAVFDNIKVLAKYLYEFTKELEDETGVVILTGCVDSPYAIELVRYIMDYKENKKVYQWEKSIINCPNTIQICREKNVSVIFIEVFEQSVKSNILQEIKYFKNMNIKIHGIVGIES